MIYKNYSIPFHEACLNQKLCQVLADGAGRAHHELQDDLPALHSVAVKTLNVSCMAVGTQRAPLISPGLPSACWNNNELVHLVNTGPGWMKEMKTSRVCFHRSRPTRQAKRSSGCLWTPDLNCIPADPPAAADCARAAALPALTRIHRDPCERRPQTK